MYFYIFTKTSFPFGLEGRLGTCLLLPTFLLKEPDIFGPNLNRSALIRLKHQWDAAPTDPSASSTPFLPSKPKPLQGENLQTQSHRLSVPQRPVYRSFLEELVADQQTRARANGAAEMNLLDGTMLLGG